MKFPSPLTPQKIADLLGGEVFGDTSIEISGLNEIHRIEQGELVFVDHPKYYDKALNSAADCILINKKVDPPSGKAIIVIEDPFSAFNRLSAMYNSLKVSVNPIADSAFIGQGTTIQPNVFIGENVRIGKNCVIHAGVTINYNCVIGNNVIIHSNAVIGGEAFYYKKRPAGYDRLNSVGNVVIENNVEIGANTTIDRGVTADTIIGEGTKIDNLVQVGHDTVIGKNCLIASQTGIAGCVVLEDDVTLWGQVGIASGITIEKGVTVYAQSGTNRTLEAGKTYFGSPAGEAKEKFKEMMLLKKLPDLIKKLS